MHKNSLYNKILLTLIIVMATPILAFSQYSSSINAFSPYTFYGIGDFSDQGPTFLRSMGGAGMGYRSTSRINTLNPASLSATGQKTFLFNMGMEGQNFYFKSAEKQTSFNTFNFRDLAIQFPLAKKIAMGVSVTPYSSVGYRVDMRETNPDILAQIGSINYKYGGSGDISQIKLSLGGEILKNFSLGADLIYYHGRIVRSFANSINPVIADATYNNTTGSTVRDYSKLWFDLGMQYNIIANNDRILTLGATYQPKLNMKPYMTRTVSTSGAFSDEIVKSSAYEDFYLPTTVKAGIFYQTIKWAAGIDYGMQNWGNLNTPENNGSVVYRNTNSIKAGVQYTPNIKDIRRFLNRWSYRLGVRYEDYYMNINGHKIDDKAITAGIGIPIKLGGMSAINIGAEVGKRGNTAVGYNGTQQFQMIKETYVKFSIGFSMFGEDYWFMRYKYQ